MTFKVDGFGEFQDELEDWADELDDVEFTRAKNRAVTRGAKELIQLIEENISNIPHNLQKLRESWRYSMANHEEISVYTKKEYAPAFEYGAEPYIISGSPLAFPAEEWDNELAKEKFGLENGDMAFFQEVKHPGFEAYFYFTNAFLEMSEGGRFEEIVEEELVEGELQEAFE